MDELTAWLTLARAPGLHAGTLRPLLDHLPSPPQSLDRVPAGTARGWRERGLIEWLHSASDERQPQTCAGSNAIIAISSRWDDGTLSAVARRTAGCADRSLFVRGDPPALVAAARHRRLAQSDAGRPRERYSSFAAHLARCGLTITSGLAIGIDAAAIRARSTPTATTIAVCGTGLDVVYPRSMRALAEAIAARGALVSEFPIGTPRSRRNFPRRNRIISGLSLGTLVVEAAVRSGSLITARLAAEQGREVFAIPGSIHNPLARGCHHLIRQGAKLVETAEDIFVELRAAAPAFSTLSRPSRTRAESARDRQAFAPALDKEYEILLDALGFEPAQRRRSDRPQRAPGRRGGFDAADSRTGRPHRVLPWRALRPACPSAAPEGGEMKESVLDILIYLFENYFDADLESAPEPDRDALKDELERAGFLGTRSRTCAGMARAIVRRSAARRRRCRHRARSAIFDPSEQARLDTDCRGYILYLENIGILNAAQRELVIDRLLALDAKQIDIEQVKWVVLMVLFSQPGQESAYLRMEDLVFEDDWMPCTEVGESIRADVDQSAAANRGFFFYGAEESRHRRIACQGEDHQEVSREELRGARFLWSRSRPDPEGRRRRPEAQLRDALSDSRQERKARAGDRPCAEEIGRAVSRDRPGSRGRGDLLASRRVAEGARRARRQGRASRGVLRDHAQCDPRSDRTSARTSRRISSTRSRRGARSTISWASIFRRCCGRRPDCRAHPPVACRARRCA